jgi:7,8-dihydroneopterin aldolase/epimerase/oxygenase
MSDRILVDRIAIYAYHGVHAEEERLGQRFYVSLDCCADLRAAGQYDVWENTICYVQLTELVSRIATGQRFKIIEALAENIAQAALSTFPRLEAITVRIEKPSAPVPAIIDGVTVEITRRRNG